MAKGTRFEIGYEADGKLRLSSAEVLHETEKALLLKFEALSHNGWEPEVWLPKSQLERHPERELRAFGVPVSVPGWWIHKHGLIKFVR